MFILNEKGEIVSVAKEYNVDVDKKYHKNLNVQLLQGFAINKVAKKEWSKQQAREFVNKNLPVAVKKEAAQIDLN